MALPAGRNVRRHIADTKQATCCFAQIPAHLANSRSSTAKSKDLKGQLVVSNRHDLGKLPTLRKNLSALIRSEGFSLIDTSRAIVFLLLSSPSPGATDRSRAAFS